VYRFRTPACNDGLPELPDGFALKAVDAMFYSSAMKGVEISNILVNEAPHAYECKASVKLEGKAFSITLLVGPGSWGKIQGGYGRKFGKTEIQQIFEARIKQYIETGILQGLPAGNIDLGCLHELEVDGLFLDIPNR
jgi:hypothetical protein